MPTYENMSVDRDKIVTGFANIRATVQTKGDRFEALCRSILDQGLTNPITVWEVTGKDHSPVTADTEPTADRRYQVIAGHRRLAALDHLGWRTVPVRVLRDATLADALAVNASENLARQDISLGEKARWCYEIRQLEGMTNAKAARALAGGDEAKAPTGAYVSILSSTWENLCEPLREAWLDEGHKWHELCKLDQLKLTVKQPAKKQADFLVGLFAPPVASEPSADGSPSGGTPANEGPKAPRKSEIGAMIAKLDTLGSSDKEHATGIAIAIATLKWALGTAKKAPVKEGKKGLTWGFDDVTLSPR